MSHAAQQIVVPEGWAFLPVAELLRRSVLLDVKDGNHGSNHPKKDDFTADGEPFITAAQVCDFQIDYLGAPKIKGEPLDRLRVGFAEVHDVVLTHKATIGRVAVATRPCVLTPQTTYYRVDRTAVDPEYLCIHHASPQLYNQLAGCMSQTTRNYVPISQQYKLWLLLPPLAEQKRIVQAVSLHLSMVRHVESSTATNAARLNRLRQSILKWAFEGKLADQDPDDEPATALLEHIRAEREAMKPKKTRRGRPRKNT